MLARFLSTHVAPLMAALLLASVGCPPVLAQELATQQSVRAGVHIAVTPASLDPRARQWEFAVSFQSDGPALRDDVLHAAWLVADGTRFAPLEWEGTPATASRHRVGILRFAAVTPLPETIEVRLQRQGEDGPRVFRWAPGGWYALASRR